MGHEWEIFWQQLGDGHVLYLLSLLSVAMILDFLSGTLIAKMRGELSSKIGINGILRKIASMVLLFFFIPIAFLVPGNTGVGLLYVLYLGYLGLELQSIFENYQKIGWDIQPMKRFLEELFKK